MKGARMHELKTYLHISFEREDLRPLFEEALSIFTKDWNCVSRIEGGESYVVCTVETYNVDVNVLYRKTLAPFLGHEKELRKLVKAFGLTLILEAVATLDCESHAPTPILSPDDDIVAFCYLTGAQLDLDYYLV